jgi:uroporphyrinogen decarboxylase
MMYEKPDLVGAIAERVGSFVVRHFKLGPRHDFVGAALLSDDWGFKTQTLFPPEFIRTYVIPWHTRVVEVVHDAQRPAILHSCGRIESVMDDVIDVCGYDGKHSFEDEITPVEEAYERWGSRIAILGGIDVDFLSRKKPHEVFKRSRRMIERTADRGGYALGSGNSIPEYVPRENYPAMLRAALV